MKLLTLISVLFLSLGICRCQTLHVPSEYPTIQSAIDAAANSDTVLVSEGTYYENVKYNGKNIVLASNYIFTKDFQTIRNTIIDGSKSVNPDSGSCVSFNNREDSTAVLEGFTLTSGFGTKYNFSFGPYQEGGGVILHYSSAVIRNNIIINNNIIAAPGAQRGGGGGIASMYGNPTICNNIIISNSSGYAGGIVLNWSGGKIVNNIIYHNTGGASFGTGGIMIWESSTSTSVENNTIIGNISLKDAGGININSTISVVKNNIVWGNRQAAGKQVLNPQRGGYNNIEDYSDTKNISVFPLLSENTFIPEDSSACIDGGDPAEEYNDLCDQVSPARAMFPSKGGTKNDIGAYGGICAKALPEISLYDVNVSKKNISFVCDVSKEANTKTELLNLSSNNLKIDNITHTDSVNFVCSNLQKTLKLFATDTLSITFKPVSAGNFTDTIKIYYQAQPGSPVTIVVRGKANPVTGTSEDKSIGYNFDLKQNFPNPFNPSTNFEFEIMDRGLVTLKVYDILGKEIAVLINRELGAGKHNISWKPGNEISSGVYLVKLIAANRAASYVNTKKIIYQK